MEKQNNTQTKVVTDEERLQYLLSKGKRTMMQTFSIPWISSVFEEVYKREVVFRNRAYEHSEEQQVCFQKLCSWMKNPKSTCGLMLAGGPGNGKTTVINTLSTIINNCGMMDPSNKDYWGKPVSAFLKVVKAYDLNDVFISEPDKFKKLKTTGLLAIDDFGTEALEIQSFGNLYSPIVDLLYARYDERKFTIISTNLTPKEIRQRYGDRMADRFNEIMTIVAFPLISFRGKKDSKEET